MTKKTISVPSTGGPSGHAGNLFQYFYAANRVMELLDPDNHVRGIRLEGLYDVPDEEILDVTVEYESEIELIQIKWSATGRRLQPAAVWHYR